MKHSIKIGIFRIGFDVNTHLLQHNFEVWVAMEGKSFRAAKRRIRGLKRQEPLPSDFQKVLDDNRWDLYGWEGE